MAYQGRKVFVAGQVLTASDVNSTVDQTVMVFADSTARDAVIPSPVEGMVAYLESDNLLYNYTGASWVSLGIPTLTADRAVITDGSGNLAASDVTATELAVLDGITASTTEINYVDGVTSSIQTQLDARALLAQDVDDKSVDYTIVAGDNGKVIRLTGATDRTFTIADELSIGERIDFLQDGTGQITFAEGAGVAIRSSDGNLKTKKQYSGATIICVASGIYHLIGDLDA